MNNLGRSAWHSLIAGLVLVAGLAIAVVPALAGWIEDLKQQALDSKRCEVGFLTDVKERTVDGKLVVFARIHCQDGRAFDASRVGDFGLFTFAACDVKSC